MSEPAITCPHCKTEIKLTESLAAPLVESTRKQLDRVADALLKERSFAFSHGILFQVIREMTTPVIRRGIELEFNNVPTTLALKQFTLFHRYPILVNC